MKITVYTITDCQFSKQEKDYLASHNLQYEEKNLETNKEFLTEMLAVSNNFAGTPVTKIEKDDGQIVVLKGFTKEEFDKNLGFATTQTPPPQPSSSPQPPKPSPPPPQSAPPKPPTPPEPAEPPSPSVPPTPSVDERLSSVLDNLQSKSNQEETSPPSPPPPPSNLPNIPDFKAK